VLNHRETRLIRTEKKSPVFCLVNSPAVLFLTVEIASFSLWKKSQRQFISSVPPEFIEGVKRAEIIY